MYGGAGEGKYLYDFYHWQLLLFDPLVSSGLSFIWDLESIFLTHLKSVKTKHQPTKQSMD